MTLEEINIVVDNYFTVHLDSKFWNGKTEEERFAAVAMAANDILSILNIPIDIISNGSPAIKAIAEQSVYLARNYENMSEGKVTTSESVEGISAGYTLIGNNYGISPRAETFIKQAKREFFGGCVRVMRG